MVRQRTPGESIQEILSEGRDLFAYTLHDGRDICLEPEPPVEAALAVDSGAGSGGAGSGS